MSGKSKLNAPSSRLRVPLVRWLSVCLVAAAAVGMGLAARPACAEGDAKPVETSKKPDAAAKQVEPVDPVAEKFAELRKLHRTDPAKAAKGFAEFITEFPKSEWTDDAQYWLALSLDRSRAGRQEVIAAYEAVVKKHPESSYRDDALFAVAETWRRHARRAEDYDQAVKAYLDFIKRSPDSKRVPEAKLKIGEVYRQVNRDKEAAVFFQQVVTDHPETTYARRANMNLAATWLRLGRVDDALALYEKLLTEELSHAERIAVQLGMVDCWLTRDGGVEKARELCEQIRAEATERKSLEDFTEYRTREKLAGYWLGLKKYVEAEAEYEAYVARFGTSVGVWQAKLNIGTIRMAAGKFDEARKVFAEIVRHQAENPTGKPAWYVPRAMYLDAQTFELEKKPEEARARYAKLAEQFPRDSYGRRAAERVKAIDNEARKHAEEEKKKPPDAKDAAEKK
ncbi:MAG TPA: tetratricopeptide repeat protein [Planctomycetota bacterium]|nr:tetratricopeptide repeat protein [Planctomycetota bacterium]